MKLNEIQRLRHLAGLTEVRGYYPGDPGFGDDIRDTNAKRYAKKRITLYVEILDEDSEKTIDSIIDAVTKAGGYVTDVEGREEY